MNDRDFLMWLHMRLTDKHKEPQIADYMHKLRAIIQATPEEQNTPNTHKFNHLIDLQKELGIK